MNTFNFILLIASTDGNGIWLPREFISDKIGKSTGTLQAKIERRYFWTVPYNKQFASLEDTGYIKRIIETKEVRKQIWFI